MVDDALRQLKSAGGALDGVEDIVTPRDAKDALTAKKMRQRPRLYDALAESIAPTVFEHKDIKHDMLLQLVGGVAKQTHDGIFRRCCCCWVYKCELSRTYHTSSTTGGLNHRSPRSPFVG